MKIIWNWLKEFIQVPASPEEVAEKLLWLGMEPKKIAREKWNPPEDSIFLAITRITASSGDKVRIRCDGVEEEVPAFYPFSVGDLVIYSPGKKRILRLGEIFPGADPDTIFLYHNPDAKNQEVLLWEDTILDWIIDIETPTNRADILSHAGIARELCAVYRLPLCLPATEELPIHSSDSFQIHILEPELCRRYAGLLGDFRLMPSPPVVQRRLLMSDMRPLTAIVDLSNYVMLELGQPTHTFDAEKIQQKIIQVRLAYPGEKAVTLDEVERRLEGSELVIADVEKVIALAGVMGCLESSVGPFSSRTFIESAYFAPFAVRKTSRQHLLRTESSLRFERDVDPEGIPLALFRIAFLMKLWHIGTPCPFLLESYPRPFETKTIILLPSDTRTVLGVAIDESEQKTILQHLGFGVSPLQNEGWMVTVPMFRRDVEFKEDLLEDIARVWGYERIPEELTPAQPRAAKKQEVFSHIEILTQAATSLGFDEVKTLSLLPPDTGFFCSLFGGEPIIAQNPLTQEMSVLRPSLIPGLLQVIGYNQRRHLFVRPIFEIGRVFTRKNGEFHEYISICFLQPEKEWIPNWQKGTKELRNDFFTWKGKLDTLFDSLGIGKITWKPLHPPFPHFHPHRQQAVYRGDSFVGICAEIHPSILKKWNIPYHLWVGEFSLSELANLFPRQVYSREINPYPVVQRDLSVLCPSDVPYECIEETIWRAGTPLLIYLALFDRYPGKDLPEGYQSFTFTLLFQHPERTLTEEEVRKQMEAIEEALKEKGVVRR
ncbi:MAG: phenylalanine--tRNA ligase subunit beta [bacterium JZ-2024 1]